MARVCGKKRIFLLCSPRHGIHTHPKFDCFSRSSTFLCNIYEERIIRLILGFNNMSRQSSGSGRKARIHRDNKLIQKKEKKKARIQPGTNLISGFEAPARRR